jgi:ATP adenylyltransferase
MDQLVAPWRIEWVERDSPNAGVDCVFCALPEREADRENRIVARNDHAYVLLNNAPYNPGHAMVIPDAHTGDYTDLTESQLLAHARLKQRTFDAIQEGLDPDGFNTGLNLGDGAGGSIDDHLHTHVVPRWEGDTNFMPVTSDTKVVVEAIEDTYERIYTAFADQNGATAASTEDAVKFAE